MDHRDTNRTQETFFTQRSVAERYARSRPYFHPIVIARIREALGLAEPIPRALDVGCGTGLSTVALREIASQVVGVDPSLAMLELAPRHIDILYVVASAQHLPFGNESFDLITVASAFHWLDRERFLDEAWRLIRPSAWLVVYDNAFQGSMAENPLFARWIGKEYLARYPSPPRDRRPLTSEESDAHGFSLSGPEAYTNDVSLTPDELADYLMTQSNIIAAVEKGEEIPDAVFAWLSAAITPLIPGPRGTFRFGGAIWYLQKR